MRLEQVAFCLLAGGAAGGVILALPPRLRLRLPRGSGTIHGLVGLTGLAVLFFANLRMGGGAPAAWWALGLTTSALVGGLILFRTLFRGRKPLPLVGLHAALAVVGLWLLNPLAFGL
ncbi:MAG: hypothetical protein PGN34_26330 [Methylobacterium frigidaeris]